MSTFKRLLDAVRNEDTAQLAELLQTDRHQAEVRGALEQTVTTPRPELARLLASDKSIHQSGDVLAGLLQKGIKHGSGRCSGMNELLKVLDILIDKGADLGYRDGQGRTALHIAAQYLFPHAVQMLMKYGAETNARDNNEQTPLMLAVQKGQISGRSEYAVCDHDTETFNRVSTVLLLQPKSDLQRRDSLGKTAETLAHENGFIELEQVLKVQGSAAQNRSLEATLSLMKRKLTIKDNVISGLQERVQWLEQRLACCEADRLHARTRVRRATSESRVSVCQRLQQMGKKIQSKLHNKPSQSRVQETDDFVVIDENEEPGIIMETSAKDIEVLHLISQQLPLQSFRFVGRRLGIQDSQLDGIEYQFKDHGLPEVCYQMLLAWKKRAVWHKQPIDDLLLVLTQEGLSDLAESVASMSISNFSAV